MTRMPAAGEAAYALMFRTMVWRLLLVSLLPLLAIGGANFYLFYRLNRSIVIEEHANALRSHRESIEVFLRNVTAQMSALAQKYTLAELMAGNLERVFPVIQQQSGLLTDIGIIDRKGNHVKYIGPYDLAGKNYRDTEWFRHVLEKGVYISDVFLGYRGVPHFIIAVKQREDGGFWILRATFNTDYFSRLVATQIGRTGETFMATFSQTRARIENATVQTALGLLPPIVAPPGHLQQIFVNLLNNALDAVAGKPNGMVLIRSRYADETVKVEISDNGCGIPAENLSRIFLPFFTSKPAGQGTGLGLAICYGLVQDIGGTIRVVLLDIKMPGQDGIQILGEIKSRIPSPEVILLTGHVSVAEEFDGLKTGAFAYLLKPHPIHV